MLYNEEKSVMFLLTLVVEAKALFRTDIQAERIKHEAKSLSAEGEIRESETRFDAASARCAVQLGHEGWMLLF